MNATVCNLQKEIINKLDIDIIKNVNGEFTISEINNIFSNFFYNKLIVDITAIKNYEDINIIGELKNYFDVSKLIIILDNLLSENKIYQSQLIELGIYNFSTSAEQITNLCNKPNQYEDVSYIIEEVKKEEGRKKIEEFEKQKEIEESEEKNKDSIKSHKMIFPNFKLKFENKFNKEESKKESYNLKYEKEKNISSKKVIIFKNLTNHAGSTSLIYMLKNILSENYDVIAIELNKNDFMYFNDNKMISIRTSNFDNYIENCNEEIILIDVNTVDLKQLEKFNPTIIYLMESSTLMLNKIIKYDRDIFTKMQDEKIILNKSLLNESDEKILEVESGINFFYTLPNLNDREKNKNILIPLLKKMNLYR